MSGPRLLVPGLVELLILDDGSGLVERGVLPDIAVSVPQQEDLGRRSLVPREAVPEPTWSRLDLSPFPQVQAQLGRVRWVLVDRATGDQVHTAGHAVLDVEGGRAGATWRPVSGPKRSYTAPDPVLWTLILGDEPEGAKVQRWAETGALQDRIVLALTEGALGLRDLELARWADGLTRRGLPHEEAVLTEVMERAMGQRDAARELLATLDAASEDRVDVSPYGEARRVADGGFTLTSGEGIDVVGPDIVVPPAEVWLIDGVEDWQPSATLERREATFADWHQTIRETRRKSKRRERIVWGLIGGLLLAGLAVGLLGQLALSSLGRDAPAESTDRAPSPTR